MKSDLKRIQRLYGEDFAKRFCRPFFSHLIEREDFSFADFLVSIISPTKFFYEDVVKSGRTEKLKNALFGVLNTTKSQTVDIQETPEELMKKAGYTLYECKTNSDIHKFKKYYAKNEELCTFGDEKRIKTHIVFWAVKDNVDEIKRENFVHPRRQDEYGTSVISIQFTRGIESTLSIKNRYNHAVEHCDATFSNDLENIQAGLTDSFKKYYGIQLVNGGKAFDIPGYVVDVNGVYHKYNYEIENIHYCADNTIIVNGKPHHFDPSRYIIADYYIFDRKNKTIELLKNSGIEDSFVHQFDAIKKIEVENVGEFKCVNVFTGNDKPVEIILNKYNQIVKLTNNNIKELGNGFMQYNSAIKELTLNNVQRIRDEFLMDNTTLEKLNIQNVVEIGDRALSSNLELKELILKKAETLGVNFLISNTILESLECPKLRSVGAQFLFSNKRLTKLYFPKLIKINTGFIKSNDNILEFKAPLLDKSKYGSYLNSKFLEATKDGLLSRIIQRLPKISMKEDILDLF